MNIIGKPRRRVDARAKVTGQTKFADDIMLPRMLHCKLLRSSVPQRAGSISNRLQLEVCAESACRPRATHASSDFG